MSDHFQVRNLVVQLPKFNTCSSSKLNHELEASAKSMLDQVLTSCTTTELDDEGYYTADKQYETETPATTTSFTTSPSIETQVLSQNAFRFIQTLAEGSFGKVKLAIDKESGARVAVKCIAKDQISQVAGSSERILREIFILSRLEHPNICQLKQVFNGARHIYLVLEYEPKGDLLSFIDEKSAQGLGIAEETARPLFKKILDAIIYCHSQGVAHRDLKPENILLSEQFEPKLIDFGLANLIRPEGGQLETGCGSLAYSAPEMILRKPYDGLKADAWSLGVLLYCILCGQLPFDDENQSKMVTKIITAKFSIPTHISHSNSTYIFVTLDAASIIKGLLCVNPNDRLDLSDIVKCAWLQSCE